MVQTPAITRNLKCHSSKIYLINLRFWISSLFPFAKLINNGNLNFLMLMKSSCFMDYKYSNLQWIFVKMPITVYLFNKHVSRLIYIQSYEMCVAELLMKTIPQEIYRLWPTTFTSTCLIKCWLTFKRSELLQTKRYS